MATDYRRPGFRTLTAGFSVEGSGAFLDFLKRAFGAREGDVNRNADGGVMHGEILVGDSLVEVSEARPEWPARPCQIHLYVPDADATYARAIDAGAVPLRPLEDASYGDRAGSVQDSWRNHWYIATRQKDGPIPAGYRTVTPYLLSKGADAVIRFMKEAFGATELVRVPHEGGIMHAELRIDDSMIEISDGGGPWTPRPSCLHIYVPDADATYQRALRAGATSFYEPTDQFYGDRESGVHDSAGNYWFISTFKQEVSKEEMERRMAAMKG